MERIEEVVFVMVPGSETPPLERREQDQGVVETNDPGVPVPGAEAGSEHRCDVLARLRRLLAKLSTNAILHKQMARA